MKSRIPIVVAASAAGLLAVWWLRAGPLASTNPLAAFRQGMASKAEVMRAVWQGANGKNLDFYGKVIDQNGQPVVGAKVRGGVGLFVDMAHSGAKEYFTETDTEGLFQFVGIRGAGLHIWLEKRGYEHNHQQDIASISHATWCAHDPKNRVVFHMWKRKGPEPLVHPKLHGLVPCDGTPAYFDILTGKKENIDGDLIVKLTRNPVNIVRGKAFNWSVTLEIPNGGLIEIKDVLYPNEAPAEGYQQSVTIDMPSEARLDNTVLDRAFYFKSRNGQDYGRMTVHIPADFQPPPTPFNADIYVNPSGSRNLEYDWEKRIWPK